MRRLTLLVLIGAAACGGGEPEEPAGRTRQQQLAARHACAGEKLAGEAQEDLALLEQTMSAAPGAGDAATSFARAFAQHAQLRAAAYAQTDSALNHAGSPQDSAQHMAAATRFEIRAPRAGTVEANVMRSYEEKLNAVLVDDDHPCNWKHELEK